MVPILLKFRVQPEKLVPLLPLPEDHHKLVTLEGPEHGGLRGGVEEQGGCLLAVPEQVGGQLADVDRGEYRHAGLFHRLWS